MTIKNLKSVLDDIALQFFKGVIYRLMFVNLNGGYQFFVKCKLCSCMFIKQISTKFDKKVTIVKQYIGRRNIAHTKKTPNIF